jgi:hypothetical protein
MTTVDQALTSLANELYEIVILRGEPLPPPAELCRAYPDYQPRQILEAVKAMQSRVRNQTAQLQEMLTHLDPFWRVRQGVAGWMASVSAAS